MIGGPVIQFHSTADDIARRLDLSGVAVLEHAVSDSWLADAQTDVRARLMTLGETDFCVINSARETDSPAHRFATDPATRSLMESLARSRCPTGVSPDEEIYSVLRVLAGPERAAPSYAFHYDASVITMLVPLLMPDAGPGRSGELVALPNRRPFRHSAVIDVAEKAATQNRFHRDRVKRQVHAAPDKYFIRMEPGNVYLFWGYRTFHGNLPCAEGAVRATLLLHFGNPHANSALIRTLRSLRRKIRPASEHTEATVIRL